MNFWKESEMKMKNKVLDMRLFWASWDQCAQIMRLNYEFVDLCSIEDLFTTWQINFIPDIKIYFHY